MEPVRVDLLDGAGVPPLPADVGAPVVVIAARSILGHLVREGGRHDVPALFAADEEPTRLLNVVFLRSISRTRGRMESFTFLPHGSPLCGEGLVEG